MLKTHYIFNWINETHKWKPINQTQGSMNLGQSIEWKLKTLWATGKLINEIINKVLNFDSFMFELMWPDDIFMNFNDENVNQKGTSAFHKCSIFVESYTTFARWRIILMHETTRMKIHLKKQKNSWKMTKDRILLNILKILY